MVPESDSDIETIPLTHNHEKANPLKNGDAQPRV